MKILVKRIFTNDRYTIGHLYIDEKYFCDTCEDADRGLDDSMDEEEIRSKKVYSKTAIPTGTYKVTMNVKSPKYGRIMPRLLNVKGFEGILIHEGNSDRDSCGCLLVGENKRKGMVINSRKTFSKLMDVLNNANDEITIEIKSHYNK